MLLLDEPTNHLDMETIDALADAINNFEGGVVLVSHDFRLIDQVAEEIWICEKETCTKWTGGIVDYKDSLKKKVMKASNKDAKSKGLAKSSRGAW
jgi:ATP-binding cassette subfamily F protein 2